MVFMTETRLFKSKKQRNSGSLYNNNNYPFFPFETYDEGMIFVLPIIDAKRNSKKQRRRKPYH